MLCIYTRLQPPLPPPPPPNLPLRRSASHLNLGFADDPGIIMCLYTPLHPSPPPPTHTHRPPPPPPILSTLVSLAGVCQRRTAISIASGDRWVVLKMGGAVSPCRSIFPFAGSVFIPVKAQGCLGRVSVFSVGNVSRLSACMDTLSYPPLPYHIYPFPFPVLRHETLASYRHQHHITTSIVPLPASYHHQHHTTTCIIPLPA